MSTDLISIAASGAAAARAALDVTGQNIANANTAGYVRRSVAQASVTTTENPLQQYLPTEAGVRVTGITRSADAFATSEVRRTASDAARADTLVTGLTSLSDAVEQSGAYTAVTQWQSALSQLASDPTGIAARAGVLQAGDTMAQSFNLASRSLAAAGSGFAAQAADGVSGVNTLAQSLASLNAQIAAVADPATTQPALLDQRDATLQQLSQYSDLGVTIGANQTASVTIGGASLVSGATAGTLSSTTASDGTLSFALGGASVTLAGGSLAGTQQALAANASATSQLNALAASVIGAANTAQGNGVALDGSGGQPMFAGTGAADMANALTDPSQIATAPAGAGANSRDASNLTALQSALTTADPAGGTSALITTLSNAVAGNTTTRDALDTIAAAATTTLTNQSGVNLDTEAANLVQYQQAFEASGKVIQTATTIFNQLLAIE